jgi:hypothetical protein
MFIDEATAKTLVLLSVFLVSCALLIGSRNQPFPEISGRFGWSLLTISALLALGEQAPRPMPLTSLLTVTLALGSVGVLVGVHHMVRTRRDVFIAPMSGFLFCIGAAGLMVQTWPELSVLEQWAGFGVLVLLGGGQTWMVFRGLLIGRLPLAWSQAGMVALQRGQLDGPHGAIACFERGWDADEEHLNPMAYGALHRIHLFLNQPEPAQRWREAFEDAGGETAVAPEWLEAIDEALSTCLGKPSTKSARENNSEEG